MFVLISLLISQILPSPAHADGKYTAEAREVTAAIQQGWYDARTGLYFHSVTDRHAEAMWGNGVIFSALAGAARHDPSYLPIMDKYFKAMDRYWDKKAPMPGYEPYPTSGNGNDKYYDDNEWMVITFAEAYEMTANPAYLSRAQDTLRFALSGWDDQLGGGIWWHEGKKFDTKNTCSNAPAAEGCVRIAKFVSPAQSKEAVGWAAKIVKWTDEHFEADDGLFMDSQNTTTLKKNSGKLTYNTALMIRANLGLYRWTNDQQYLREAKRSGLAANWFLDKNTGAYRERDDVKWSHLQVEADLELYRTTHEDYLLARAKSNADHFYTAWKAKPPAEVIDEAAIARILWLMADTETDAGRRFWAKSDRVTK